MRRFPVWLLLGLIAAALAQFACEGADDDDAGDEPADDDQSPDDDDTSPDAMSGASPERDSTGLNQSHAGWRNPACFSCHDDVHRGGFGLGECVVCHGGNGAPRRPAGHANRDCASCHADRHAGLDFSQAHCQACHKYESGVTCPVTEDYDAVVIGAGGGGLAAAATLAKAGLNVALVEKHYKPGGYMVTFHRGDYVFEASLHAINGLATNPELQALGVLDRLEPLPADPMYRAVFPGREVSIPANRDAYRALLKSLYPHEAAGIDALFAEMESINVIMTALEALEAGDLSGLWTILTNLPAGLRVLGYLDLTLKEMVAKYVSDPQVTGIFEQLVTFLGAGPGDLQALYFLSMWNGYHREGYFYLTGGSQAISNALADVVTENGGTIKYNTLATKIVIEDGRAVQVQTQDDACLNTRYVVSNANAPDTLLKMIGPAHLPADYVARLNQMTIGVAAFQVFLGIDHDYRELFPGSHEIMVNVTFNMDEAFAAMNAGDVAHVPFIIADYTAIDPTTAAAGKNSMSLTTYLPWDMLNTWQWDDEYEQYIAAKESAARTLIERAEAFLPGLRDHVEILEVGSPVTNYAFSLNPRGTIFGWANTPEQGTLRRLPMQTPIDNVLLAGAWTFPGGGQAAVIDSGVQAANKVLAKER
jgi:prolycopene isomerase